ncbi:hypothetical protein F5883DRAFT_527406 [Diaporthe sp. PMI_573]|nr:hypothetical protein F5883DRAFT_527406 [Diaporthaceae sp. PMI_573]
MVAIGIPVCRPLWKGWVSRLLPGGEQDQIYSDSYYSGQQRTIGGSEMLPSKKGHSKSKSKSRKGSKGSKSLPSDINIHCDDVEMLDDSFFTMLVRRSITSISGSPEWQLQPSMMFGGVKEIADFCDTGTFLA